jgi:hypothetical protein
MGEAGAGALLDSPHLGNLVELRLGSNQIGPAGARAVREWPRRQELEVLELGNNPGLTL